MKIYVAGPMRNYPHFNYEQFNQVTMFLRNLGYIVFSPAEYDVNYRGLDLMTMNDQSPVPTLASCMVVDLAEVCSSDIVATLDGWERSQGAKLEVLVAQYLKIPVVPAAELINLKRIAIKEELNAYAVPYVTTDGRTATVVG